MQFHCYFGSHQTALSCHTTPSALGRYKGFCSNFLPQQCGKSQGNESPHSTTAHICVNSFMYTRVNMQLISLQCFDTVGLATGRNPACKKTGCWFVDRDEVTGALHNL